MYKLQLNEQDRARLAKAFANHRRVDMGIDCVIEGQMGEAYADDAENLGLSRPRQS